MKLRTGQTLTEEMVEMLMREAEAGLDPARTRPRRVGHPSLGEGTSPRVQFRLDSATYEVLLAKARAEDRDAGEIARTALERYLRDVPTPAGGVGSSAGKGTPR